MRQGGESVFGFHVTRIDIDIKGHMNRAQGEKLWTYAASEWHRLYREYVPFREGVLYNQVNITGGKSKGTIEHTAPYAHYIYEGVVYGPNVPITQGGVIVGYFSPEAPKHSTGQQMTFSRMFSAKASRHWDEAARPTQLPMLIQSVQKFVNSGALNFGG